MVAGTIPIKTAEGQAELSARQRSVSQRHRTVLFLVDGRRSAPDVRSLASRAGVPDSCFDDLLELGMIALPIPATAAARKGSAMFDAFDADGGLDSDHIDLPMMFDTPSSSMPLESTLPPARSLFPEDTTAHGALGPLSATDPWRRADSQAPSRGDARPGAAAGGPLDPAFDVARQILLRAVRAEAPLTGSLTLLRLRRARTRAELHGLLGEVESRIAKPHRALAASQVIRRARELLEGRVDVPVDRP